jgi:hypothetical protein
MKLTMITLFAAQMLFGFFAQASVARRFYCAIESDYAGRYGVAVAVIGSERGDAPTVKATLYPQRRPGQNPADSEPLNTVTCSKVTSGLRMTRPDFICRINEVEEGNISGYTVEVWLDGEYVDRARVQAKSLARKNLGQAVSLNECIMPMR